MGSPTSRTLELLRKEGWTAEVVERWNPHSKTRKDLGGGIDVLAWRPPAADARPLHCAASGCPSEGCTWCDYGLKGIQACAGASHSARKAKLLSEKKMAIWVAAGGRLEVWSWTKKGPRGKRKLWEVRREAINLSDFIPEAA